MEQILSLPAICQAELLRTRALSSCELIRAHLERIAEVNPRINAVIEVFAERALHAASAADARLAAGTARTLEGVPFSVKDSMEIEGAVCTAGTVGFQNAAPATRDATLVARLRGAGAIPIARTNLPDLLFSFESDNLLFGRTNHPHDAAYTSGGSSGGEAALIASCGSPLGLGSDAAGSVRLPAAFCGIAGIKPTSGRLPRTGHVPPAGGWIEALWQIGPMARSVADLIAVMPILSGADGIDYTSPDMPLRDVRAVNVADLRVAVFAGDCDAEVADVVRAAGRRLANAEEASPACLADAWELEMKLLGADGGDGVRAYLAEIGSHEVHPLLTGWLDKLEAYRTDVAGVQRYWQEWDGYRASMAEFARRFDVLICPAYSKAGLRHGESVQDENFRGFRHTMAFNVAGWPAAVVRCGTSANGLPIAVQVAAAPWREDLALAVAAHLESLS
ncbi:MAG TPA: amidase [Candidatus Acidoferrum sp.]|nr:amidase [Candidatus Acidoferrum sp.]